MSRLRTTEPVAVDLGPCECPGTPHEDGDKAWLRPGLTPEGGARATHVLMGASARGEDATIGALSMAFLVGGLVGWTLLDDDGKPLSYDEETLASGRIDWETTLSPIANRADALYATSVINPLVKGLSEPLQRGPTEASTSPTNGSSSPSLSPSEPSTTLTTTPSLPTGKPTALASSI